MVWYNDGWVPYDHENVTTKLIETEYKRGVKNSVNILNGTYKIWFETKNIQLTKGSVHCIDNINVNNNNEAKLFYQMHNFTQKYRKVCRGVSKNNLLLDETVFTGARKIRYYCD